MTTSAQQMQSDRAARDSARAALDTQLTRVREDLDARSIGGRVADTVIGEAADVALEAVDILDRHRRIVGGTGLAFMAWVFRKPLIAGGRRTSDAIRHRWSSRRLHRWHRRLRTRIERIFR